MITRARAITHRSDFAPVGIASRLCHGAGSRGCRTRIQDAPAKSRVAVQPLIQLRADVSNVTDFEEQAVSKLALHAHREGLRLGLAQSRCNCILIRAIGVRRPLS